MTHLDAFIRVPDRKPFLFQWSRHVLKPPTVGDTVLSSSGEGRIVDFDVDTGYVRYKVNGVTVPVLFIDLTWDDTRNAWILN